MPRPIRARIDLAALRHNYLVAKRHAGAARAWAVVKANAYGHGLLRAAGALAGVADGFALLDVEDALALREAGIRQPILLLEGFFDAVDLAICAEYRLTPAIHRLDQLEILRNAALPVRLPVYIKLNTGMNRLGFAPAQLPAVRRELDASPAVGAVTLMSHFAEADGGRGIDWQMARFAQMTEGWTCPLSPPASLAN